MKRTILFLGLSCLTASALAGGFDDVVKMQKNGMWEVTTGDSKEKPNLYCVTEQDKLDGRKTMEGIMKDAKCKTVRDSLSGDRFELQHQCPTMLMTMTGTATPVEVRTTTTLKATGNSPESQMLAKYLGEKQTEHWRWIRPCRAGEKPGLQ